MPQCSPGASPVFAQTQAGIHVDCSEHELVHLLPALRAALPHCEWRRGSGPWALYTSTDLTGGYCEQNQRLLMSVYVQHPFDYALIKVPFSLADFRIMLFDMDETLIDLECIDELADMAGCRDTVARLTALAMQGDVADYDASLQLRVQQLRGLTEARIASRFSDLPFVPGASDLCRHLRASGLTLGIVTGGFTHVANTVARELEVSYLLANRLQVRDGVLTGELDGEIVNAAAKARVLQRMCHETACDISHTIAVGDGANDLNMMRLAGLRVGRQPKEILFPELDVVLGKGNLSALINLLPGPKIVAAQAFETDTL